jgi:MFS family permease
MSMVASPFIGKWIDGFGRKNTIILGFIFIFSATVGFGLLVLVDNE